MIKKNLIGKMLNNAQNGSSYTVAVEAFQHTFGQILNFVGVYRQCGGILTM